MTDHDDAVTEASARVAALQVGLADLNANIDAVLARKKELDGLASAVGGLKKYGRRNRVLIWLALLSLAIDLTLTVVIYTTSNHADSAARHAKVASVLALQAVDQAKLNARNVHNNCVVGNDFRQTEHGLWQYLLNVPPATPPTAAQQQQRAAFQQVIDEKFAVRDCDRVAPLP